MNLKTKLINCQRRKDEIAFPIFQLTRPRETHRAIHEKTPHRHLARAACRRVEWRGRHVDVIVIIHHPGSRGGPKKGKKVKPHPKHAPYDKMPQTMPRGYTYVKFASWLAALCRTKIYVTPQPQSIQALASYPHPPSPRLFIGAGRARGPH